MIETDDFLADLERYLREAAEKRDTSVARPRIGRVLPSARRFGVAAVVLLGVAGVIVLGRGALSSPPDDIAVAPPSVTTAPPSRTPAPPAGTPTPDEAARARTIVTGAVRELARARACRLAADAVPAPVDKPLSPAIANLLPGLASGPGMDPAALRLEPMTARGVLRSSARQISLGSGLSLTVYVLDGIPIGGLADPAGCLTARLARAATLSAGESAIVQRDAQRRLRETRDTAPGLQTLMLQVSRQGHQGSSGAGLPVWSQHALRPAVTQSGSAGNGRTVYVAIAERRATHVVVHTPKPFTVPVEQGFYGLVLAHGTGRVTLDETAADGSVVATRTLR
jgi:hypothetical protein